MDRWIDSVRHFVLFSFARSGHVNLKKTKQASAFRNIWYIEYIAAGVLSNSSEMTDPCTRLPRIVHFHLQPSK